MRAIGKSDDFLKIFVIWVKEGFVENLKISTFWRVRHRELGLGLFRRQFSLEVFHHERFTRIARVVGQFNDFPRVFVI